MCDLCKKNGMISIEQFREETFGKDVEHTVCNILPDGWKSEYIHLLINIMFSRYRSGEVFINNKFTPEKSVIQYVLSLENMAEMADTLETKGFKVERNLSVDDKEPALLISWKHIM